MLRGGRGRWGLGGGVQTESGLVTHGTRLDGIAYPQYQLTMLTDEIQAYRGSVLQRSRCSSVTNQKREIAAALVGWIELDA